MTLGPLGTLAPDPMIPQRDVLLDTATMIPRLARRLGVRRPLLMTQGERIRAKYRIGESLRLLHRLQVDGRWLMVASRTFPAGRSTEVYQRAAAQAVACEGLCPVMHDADLHTVFWTFPNDRKVANLSVLVHTPPPLRSLLGLPWNDSRLVAYAPEQSATAQCLDEHGAILAYAKVYAGDEVSTAYWTYQRLGSYLPADHPHLTLPRALACSEAYRTLLVKPIVGPRLLDLRGTTLQTALHRLGAALATLHTLVPPEGRRFTRLDVPHLQQAAHLLSLMRPDVQEYAETLAHALQSRWAGLDEPLVCVHGDVHFNNVIVTAERIALIDLDQVAVGPAAADLGGVLARLRYACCLGFLSEGTRDALSRVFVGGYASVRQPPHPAALRWYTAAALLVERALRAVNGLRPLGLCHLEALLADAIACLSAEDAVSATPQRGI